MTCLIDRLGFVALSVTDLDRSVQFAQHVLGMRETERSSTRSYLSCNTSHHELVLTAADSSGLERVGLEVRDETRLGQIRELVEQRGFAVLPAQSTDSGAVVDGFCFRFTGGTYFEVFHGMKRFAVADGFYNVAAPRPRKLGHVTLRSDDVTGYLEFFCGALGFEVSDWLGDKVVWIRNGVDHHSLAVINGGEGMHHYALELESFAAYAQLGDTLIGQHAVLEYGPGRHGPGYNFFTYLRDPDGMLCEHFADLQKIEDVNYEPRVWPVEASSLNQWGPAPPDSWLPSLTPNVELAVGEPSSGSLPS